MSNELFAGDLNSFTPLGREQKNIDNLFQDGNENGIVLMSTIHKIKGKEADNVFVLADTLRSHDQTELNLQYVSFTRAKNKLYLVGIILIISGAVIFIAPFIINKEKDSKEEEYINKYIDSTKDTNEEPIESQETTESEQKDIKQIN